MNRTPVSDPAELVAIFERDPEVHLYGLADLEEPFWSASLWYRDDEAVIGRVSVDDDWVAGYAMASHAPEATLALVREIEPELPPATWITGPPGMAEHLSATRALDAKGPHWRVILEGADRLGHSNDVSPLTEDHLHSVQDLHQSDPGAVFFLPAMLGNGHFVGIWEDGRLVASAGTHVASVRYGVVAIGAVITRPSHRGRGLAAAVLSGLARELLSRYRTIGLNVVASNVDALRLYEGLGFRVAHQYEEVELR